MPSSPVVAVFTLIAIGLMVLYFIVTILFAILLPRRDPECYSAIGSPGFFDGSGGGIFGLVNRPNRISPPMAPQDGLLKLLLLAAQVDLYLVGFFFILNIAASVLCDK